MGYGIDIAIIGVVALSVLTGLFRGFIKEVIALSIWILAIWLAFNYSQLLEPWLQQYIQDKTARTVASFILIMLAVLIVGGIANALLGFILKRSGLSGTDRLLGMGFGFVRGIFIVALILVVIKMTSLPYQEYSRESKLYAKFDPLVNWLDASMPEFVTKVKTLDAKKGKALPSSQQIFDKLNQVNLNDLSNDFEFTEG